MTAIVTNQFRVANARNFKTDVENQVDNGLYVFIGKSDPWGETLGTTANPADDTTPIPEDKGVEVSKAHVNMIAAKRMKTGDVVHVVPRHNWTYGNTYFGWNDRDEDIFTKQFYVLNNFKVYKCIKAGPGASTESPEYEGLAPFLEADGYVWKYMYPIGSSDVAKFLTNFYMPVNVTPSYEDAGLAGKIYRIVVTDGGTGYSSSPTVTIRGDGTGATVSSVVVESGTITAINVSLTAGSDNGTTLFSPTGSGYNYAWVEISDTTGVGATAYPVLSPKNGHGTDPISELGGFYSAINVSLEYDDGGDFIVNNSFRQIGVLRNPFQEGSTTNIIQQDTFNALYTLNLKSVSTTDFIPGDYVEGTTSGAIAFVDEYDNTVTPKTLKYHQNEKTGFTNFIAGEEITGYSAGSGFVADSNSVVAPDHAVYSGEIIFIENRDPINRSASQIEDLKIVIEF